MGTVCQPFLDDISGHHSHRCTCGPGLTGEGCKEETTANFRGDSLLAFVTSPAPPEYRLSLRFRTTIGDGILAIGDDILSTRVFQLSLATGRLKLNWLDDIELNFDSISSFIDANWHSLEIIFSQSQLNFKVDHQPAKTVPVVRMSMPIFSTKFGGLPGSPKLEANFVGCMQDIEVNGAVLVPAKMPQNSVNLGLGCDRTPQCANNSCSEHGKCVDLWMKHKCVCERPFLEPRCEHSLSAATFGYERNQSYAEVLMSPAEKVS